MQSATGIMSTTGSHRQRGIQRQCTVMYTCAENASEFEVFGNESTAQSFSFDGTHAIGPDCTRIASLTLAYMSSGVSPRTIAETKKTDNATDQQLITNH